MPVQANVPKLEPEVFGCVYRAKARGQSHADDGTARDASLWIDGQPHDGTGRRRPRTLGEIPPNPTRAARRRMRATLAQDGESIVDLAGID